MNSYSNGGDGAGGGGRGGSKGDFGFETNSAMDASGCKVRMGDGQDPRVGGQVGGAGVGEVGVGETMGVGEAAGHGGPRRPFRSPSDIDLKKKRLQGIAVKQLADPKRK